MKLDDYLKQSAYSDPGQFGGLFDALPADPNEIARVARNVIVHYRASGPLPQERMSEVDNRWLDRILGCDQGRHPMPLAEPRELTERVGGCCRDFTLFTVGALRHKGIPARSRAGFASYLMDGFNFDHVVAEYWDDARWVFLDSQLEPGPHWELDVADIPHRVGARPEGRPYFETGAQAWAAYRRGEIPDESLYGVAPGVPIGGGWFIHNYVFIELAHRYCDELLLWDSWGGMAGDLDGDLSVADELAELLLAADDGDMAAKVALFKRYARDERAHPGRVVQSVSPTNGNWTKVDLATREVSPLT